MFSNILILLLVLLMASLAPEVSGPYWEVAPWSAFGLGMALYACLLGLLVVQGKLSRIPYALLNILAQVQILLFLVVFLYLLDGLRVLPDFATVAAGAILLLYSGALAVFYAASHRRSSGRHASCRAFVEGQLRLTLPFAVPYLLLTLFSDLLSPWVSLDPDTPLTIVLLCAFFGGFMVLMMAVVPPMLVKAWRCLPLPSGAIRDGLEDICRKAGFRYRAMLSWTILKHMATAAILGVFPRYRYVMFTDLMLRELSLPALKSVLAHEIGHSRHYHLLLYPFVLFGGLVCASLTGWLLVPALGHWLELHQMPTLLPLASLLPYGIVIALYFRFVFGFFSRLFERQADLSVFSLGVHPQEMVEALHTVAVLGGNVHDQPSWHHFSIRQRIETLEAAERNPSLVLEHTKRVNWALLIYSLLFAMGLVLVSAPSFPQAKGLTCINRWMEKAAQAIDSGLNR